MKLQRHPLRVLVAAFALVAAASCTSSSPGPPDDPATGVPDRSPAASAVEPGVQVVRVQGNDALRFEPSSLAVKPGRVRLVFTVTGKLPQTFTSRPLDVDSGNVPPGQSVTLDIMVPRAGRYVFYSAYHQKQGMTGTLVARA